MGPDVTEHTHIAVILPCLNEEMAIAATVQAFRAALPDAMIVVYDNGSEDRTVELAERAGALVASEPRRGKGNVVRRAFADLDADIFVIADGDGTYDVREAGRMVHLLETHGLDMVTARREHSDPRAYRRGHIAGNRLFSRFVSSLFGTGIGDVFSGYRVLSRRFVKSFPAMAEGFEIEAEMSIHALQLRMPIAEHAVAYSRRGEGSRSKLHTLHDGLRILRHVVRLNRLHRPRLFFGLLGTLVVAASLAIGIPVVLTYLEIGQVPRFPSAILAASLSLLGALLWLLGFVLESTSQLSLEMKRLRYLEQRAPARVRQPHSTVRSLAAR